MFTAYGLTGPWRVCPCGSDVRVAPNCTGNDEWLFVCPSCLTTWTKDELIELALDRAFAQTPSTTNQEDARV